MSTFSNRLIEVILRKIVIIGSFLVVLVPLVVIPQSYFPYIIQKTYILRVLLEFIFAAYLVLALWRPEYRPKKSLLLWAVLGFAAAMLITTFTSQSLFRSWWGNWERSFGTFNYLHYFLWFIALVSVFKNTVQWNRIINLSLLASLAISLYSIAQRLGLPFTFESGLTRVNGTIGNAAFLASYLLLHLFIALLFLVEKRGWKWKIYYLAVFLIDLFVLFLTGTRGAQLALFFAIIIFIILVLWMKIWQIKFVKLLLLVSVLTVLAGGVLYAFKNTEFVQGNYWLSRLTSYSLADNTVQTRLRTWHWGILGFRDNLLFGVGPDNYHIVFNRYFQPDFYDYTGSEIWFDRAHNTLIDMASMMGILGLLTYLGIFAAAVALLIKFQKNNFLSKLTFIVLLLLFVSYFFQNIIVFDSLNSLIVFYLLLAYLVHLDYKFKTSGNAPAAERREPVSISPVFSGPIVFILFLTLFFTVNWREIKANLDIYDAYILAKMNNYEQSMASYDKAYPVAINKVDPAILLSSSLSEMIGGNAKISSPEDEIENLKKAASWMDRAIELEPKSMFLYYLQAKNYALLTELSLETKYLEKGIMVAKQAQELSPGNVRPLWILGQLYLYGGQPETAIGYLEKAMNLNPRLPESYFYLSIVYKYLKNDEKYYEMIDGMLDHNYHFYSTEQVGGLIAHYEEKNDIKRLIKLAEALVKLEKNNSNYWMQLVDLLEADGQFQSALETLKQAADAIPALSSRAYTRYDEILNKIDAQK